MQLKENLKEETLEIYLDFAHTQKAQLSQACLSNTIAFYEKKKMTMPSHTLRTSTIVCI